MARRSLTGYVASPVATIRRHYIGTLACPSYSSITIPFNNTPTNINNAFSQFASDGVTAINGIRCLQSGVVDVSCEIRFEGGNAASHNVTIFGSTAATNREGGVTFAGNGRVPVASTIVVNAGDILVVSVYVEASDIQVFADGPTHVGFTATYLGPAA